MSELEVISVSPFGGPSIAKRPQDVAFRPERVLSHDVGAADWVINDIEVQHQCCACGELMEITDTDPHWSTGRGPICPWLEGLRQACRTWLRHIESTIDLARVRPVQPTRVQVALDRSAVVPFGGSVTIMLLRRWMEGWRGDEDGVLAEVDAVIEDVLYACWTVQ